MCESVANVQKVVFKEIMKKRVPAPALFFNCAIFNQSGKCRWTAKRIENKEKV
jgi:hypothetical protein